MLRSNSNHSVPNYGLENFATVSRSCCQHSSTVELVDDTYNRYGRRIVRSWLLPVYMTVTLSHRFVLDLLSNFVRTVTVAAC